MSPNPKTYQLSNNNNQDMDSFLRQIQNKEVQQMDVRRQSLNQINEVLKSQMAQKDQMKNFER